MKVIHFNNGSGGGVLSVIRNLFLYQQDKTFEQEIIYTVNAEHLVGRSLQILNGIAIERLFTYSPKWNFYYTCRQLAKTIPDEQAIIIANDWLELGMVSHLGLKNPVVLILHGDYDYYYHLAVKHAVNIDIFICIASNIQEKLKKVLPFREDDIYYQRFPVSNLRTKKEKNLTKTVIFVGRCEREKGYDLLPIIDEKLKKINCEVSWTIIGDGKDFKKVIWSEKTNVKFLKEIPNKQVLDIIPENSIILLPSVAEGMPVAIIEAMKAGVIPIVNDIKGGIDELIENGVTGYKVNNNDCDEYAYLISLLFSDNKLINQLSIQCIEKANSLFDPVQNTKGFEILYKIAEKRKVLKYPKKIYGSFLDKNWIPNIFVVIIRRFIFVIKN